MLKGEKITFIRHNLIEGVNKETKAPYAFANMTVSDGLESVEIPLDLNLVNQCVHFQKGDKLNLDIEVTKQGNNTKIKIIKIQKVA